MIPPRRLLLATLLVAASIVGTASPAAAHSVSGVSATNYRTRLKAVRPAVPGVEVKVIETGSRLQLTNNTFTDVIVRGYQGEPYLRVGPRGVFENRRSPATYLNASRQGENVPPASADPSKPPQWRKVSDGEVARWHDHRAHFMGSQDPPAVKRNPGREHVINPNWTVEMRHGSTTIIASGDLRWIPGPSVVPWLLMAAGLAAIAVAVGVSRFWAAGVAVLIAVLVANDVVYKIGVALFESTSAGGRVVTVVGAGFYSVLAWGAGVAGIVALLRGRAEGLFAAAFAALVALLFTGLTDIQSLFRSQIHFGWDPSLGRAGVAVSLGLGVGITVAAVLGVRRHLPITLAPPQGQHAAE